ncbi:MAG: NADH-quinone oxidoreductase subunit NuoH [Planctomycetes bacterium]|nr:NADH-quinone oxidoreductase subunit NuoH [Planctomycetota bacterium]
MIAIGESAGFLFDLFYSDAALHSGIRIFILINIVMLIAGFLVYFERKVCALIQNRLGPNRVGPRGLLQWVADAIKLITKEDIFPDKVDRKMYFLAPIIAFAPGLIALAVIPFGSIGGDASQALVMTHVNIGLLFVLAVTSISVYGIAFGGWASNNKFSLLGSLRSSAQMVSYEIAMGLSLVAVILVCESVDLREVVTSQYGTMWGFVPNWFCFRQPLAFLIFFVAAFAEGNRLPFDLPEAEPELVGGYHTEYSSMKFGMFFLGEYAAMTLMAAFTVTLFFGGWHVPFVFGNLVQAGTIGFALVSVLVFAIKLALVLFFYLWVRWTLPRFRYDQLMNLGWKVMIPLALANIVITGAFEAAR